MLKRRGIPGVYSKGEGGLFAVAARGVAKPSSDSGDGEGDAENEGMGVDNSGGYNAFGLGERTTRLRLLVVLVKKRSEAESESFFGGVAGVTVTTDGVAGGIDKAGNGDLLGMMGSGPPAALAVKENRGCWGMVIERVAIMFLCGIIMKRKWLTSHQRVLIMISTQPPLSAAKSLEAFLPD